MDGWMDAIGTEMKSNAQTILISQGVSLPAAAAKSAMLFHYLSLQETL